MEGPLFQQSAASLISCAAMPRLDVSESLFSPACTT
jgi:hypothetical protein